MAVRRFDKSGSPDGLDIPVFYGSLDETEKPVIETATESMPLRHSLLEQLFTPEEFRSLVVVKVSEDTLSNKKNSLDDKAKVLRNRTFPDGQKRAVTFSSGKNFYFCDLDLRTKIGQFVATEQDSAFRYGSLLTSDCLQGIASFENLRIKLVDFNDPEQARQYHVGDCHGKISPQLAEAIGAEFNDKFNTPFQFRFAYRQDWKQDGHADAPQCSFLAKGTVQVDATLTEEQGYDLILDRSSVKGILKSELDTYLPLGDYDIPKAIIGNRSNAQVTEYDNSWQFTVWFSEAAVLDDFGPATLEKAQELQGLQDDPVQLAQYIVEQYDKRQAYIAKQQQEQDDTEAVSDESEPEKKQDAAFIEILRNDRYGQLLSHPKIAEQMQDFLARQWRELAVKSGFTHSSAMAMPAPELERGVVCIPHLPEGDVVVTRYPIVSRDNIRIYTNTHEPNIFSQAEDVAYMMQTKSSIWIHPKDIEDFHQGDFDGDQLLCTPADRLPTISREIHRAGEDAPYDFEPVKKRPKLTYADSPDFRTAKGNLDFPKIAIASSENDVGQIANAIGRVQSSVSPTEDSNGLSFFEADKQQLLNRLFDGLQVEVGYQKSAERHCDVEEIQGDRLLQDANKWKKQHPVPFFDFKSDRAAYKQYPIPTTEAGTGSVNAIAREIVNPIWQASQLQARDRSEFRYLFEKPDLVSEAIWDKFKDKAADFIEQFNQANQQLDRSSSDFPKFYSETCRTFREKIEKLCHKPGQMRVMAAAVGHQQHTHNQRSATLEKCLEVAHEMGETVFYLEPSAKVPGEALPREAYVLTVPFSSKLEPRLDRQGNIKRDRNGPLLRRAVINPEQDDYLQGAGTKDAVLRMKQHFDQRGIAYDAVISDRYPAVEFIFKPLEQQPDPKIASAFIAKLDKLFGDKPLQIPDDRPESIIAPLSYQSWAKPLDDSRMGKASFTFNVFAPEIAEILREREPKLLKSFGVQYGSFANESFQGQAWEQPVTIRVGKLKFDPSDPRYLQQHGKLAFKIKASHEVGNSRWKTLGTLAPDTAKLPFNTQFEARIVRLNDKAVELQVVDGSIRLPLREFPITTVSSSAQVEATTPQSSRTTRSTSQSQSVSQEDAPTKQPQASNSKQQLEQTTTMLVNAIAQMKQVDPGRTAFEITPNSHLRWTAFVRANGITTIQDDTELTPRTVARFNVQTGELIKPLSGEDARLLKQVLQTAPLQQNAPSLSKSRSTRSPVNPQIPLT